MSIALRKIRREDLELVMNWRMMPEVTKYMYTDPKLTMDSQIKWFEKISSDDTVKYWIIEYDNQKIGVINLSGIDNVNKKCTWGYYIAEDGYRGKGIARHLELNIYYYVFEVLELNKIYSEVFSFNHNVIEIHKKFGSEIEGELRDHIYKNKKFHNVTVMGMFKSKWYNIRDSMDYEKIFIEE